MDKKAEIINTKPQNIEESDRAFMVETEIRHRRAEIAKNFLELGRLFKLVRDEKLYKLRDHPSFLSFLADVGFRRTTVYSYIHVYELYILKLKIVPDFLITVPYRQLQMINPVVEKNPEEWIYKAKELSESDLITEVRAAQKKPLKEYPKSIPGRPELFDFNSYLEFVKAYGCILHPGRKADPAHFPRTQKAGAPDHWRIPLCRECHDSYHHDSTDFLMTYKDQIFDYFYSIVFTCFKLTKEKK